MGFTDTAFGEPLVFPGGISFGTISLGANGDFGTDASNFGGTDNQLLGVDVLFDQDQPRNPDSWTHIKPDSLSGNVVNAIGIERRDVVWFSVASVGLRRWDVNGRSAGPDDPLTWDDQDDDYWTGFANLPGSDLDRCCLSEGDSLVYGEIVFH